MMKKLISPLFCVLYACGGQADDSTTGAQHGEQSCSRQEFSAAVVRESTIELATPCAAVSLEPEVIGSGEWTVRWEPTQGEGLQPIITTSTGGTFEALVLRGTLKLAGDEPLSLWKQGYQSWSWSGVTLPGTATLDDNNIIVAGGDGDGTTVIAENDTSSWWVGLIGRPSGGSLVLGAQEASTTRFYMGVDGDNVQAVWGNRGEHIRLETEQSLSLDPLVIGAGSDPNALLEAYADAVAERVSPRPLDAPPPTGWATWYQYYSEVNEEDVRANLAALTSDDGPDVDVFQIDDGWQLRWGDWWAGDDFPSGMRQLAQDIEQTGMTPGLWLAPFYVSTDSETYQTHPDWWVQREDGEPIRFTNLGTGNYVILDVTHPDAAIWLEQTLQGIASQGWAYLKLDFLYAGAQEGRRAEDVTGIEAYRLGMDILRRAAGDAWVLACGAPLLPSVGYAESMRTGADIAFEVSTEPTVAYYRWQLRSTAARLFTHGRWWWMDPDQLIVRAPLTEVEVSGALASGLAAGGTWMLGDDLTVLPEERLSALLDPELVSRLGQTARPLDPLRHRSGVDPGPVVEELTPNDQPPTSYILADGTQVLVNLSDTEVSVSSQGGTNILTGEQADAQARTLLPGAGEVWVR